MKYGDISLVLCISTRLRLVTILSLLVKYLVIFHADPCNKSYVSIVSVSADIPSVDPGSNSVESSFLSFFFFFFPSSFFFSLSLSARWFNTYQIPILFLSSFSFFPLRFFFPPFLSSSNFPLAFPMRKSVHVTCMLHASNRQ